ncbi:hypothetical protein [Prochlorothrix hollandica]|uniref:hypothetical protein n=1 Tax=Prochlorothrix hollandica TaxID=1223 RepID=UPI00333E2406
MAIVLITYLERDQETAQQAAISLQSAGHQTQCYPWIIDCINPENPWDSLITTTADRLTHISHAYLILCLRPTNWPHWITWQQIAALSTQLVEKNTTLIPAILPELESLPSKQPDSHWIQDLITIIQLNESTQHLSYWLYSHHINEDELVSQFKQLRQQNYNALAAS